MAERGGMRDGKPQLMDRRLFMQLLVMGNCRHTPAIVDSWANDPAVHVNSKSVIYADVTDPMGVALLTVTENPSYFVDVLRPKLLTSPWDDLALAQDMTMFGRTYSLGYEPDLKETLIDRPIRTVLNPAWSWAVWYPLRRSGEFATLSPEDQRSILGEHGTIGRAYGEADYAHDVRLACHGMDRHDNDFVVGVVGKELHPLSHLVQGMRRTKQTSMYLECLGPFFVGKVLWQSSL